MDQNPLVTEQVEVGEAVVNGCLADGVEVIAAFWVNPSEEGHWAFYVATTMVEEHGLAAGYKAVLGVLRRLELPPGLDPLEDVKVIGATHPIARGVLEVQAKYGAPLATHYRDYRLGNLAIAEAYLYPPVQPARSPA